MESLQVNSEEVKKETSPEENENDQVVLSRAQYEAVLARFEELEAKTPSRSDDDIDALADEGRKAASKAAVTPQQRKDIEDMSNAELVNYMLEQISPVSRSLETEVNTLKVQREIDKCEKEFEDFHDYDKEILKIALENPSLTIERAYKIAKAENKKEAKGEAGEKGEKITTSQKILNLPHPKTYGEKASLAATSPGGSLSIKDSARKAAIELGLDK
jgi:hypothetical protein